MDLDFVARERDGFWVVSNQKFHIGTGAPTLNGALLKMASAMGRFETCGWDTEKVMQSIREAETVTRKCTACGQDFQASAKEAADPLMQPPYCWKCLGAEEP